MTSDEDKCEDEAIIDTVASMVTIAKFKLNLTKEERNKLIDKIYEVLVDIAEARMKDSL